MVQEKVKRFISPEDIKKLENIVHNTSLDLRIKTIFFLIRSTGMRTQEAADVLREDVNLHERYLLVRISKNKKPKYIPFSINAQKYLKEWFVITRRHGSKYLFPSARDVQKPIHRNRIYEDINQVFAILWPKQSDVIDHPNGAHVLRHTFVQEWCEKGGDWRGLQFIMGWSSLKPLESYLRMSPELVKKHYRAIENKKWRE